MSGFGKLVSRSRSKAPGDKSPDPFINDFGKLNISSPNSTQPSSASKSGPSSFQKLSAVPQKSFQIKSKLAANKTTDESALHRSSRAAALICLGRLGEAVTECLQAIRIDSTYLRPRRILVSVLIRLGRVDDARKHLRFVDYSEQGKVHAIAKSINLCGFYRHKGDWESVLREANSAIDSGADACHQVLLCKAEAQLNLIELEDAEDTLESLHLLERLPNSSNQYFGMVAEAYLHFVISRIHMASGRLESAVANAKIARQIDTRNVEVHVLLNVRVVRQFCYRGDALVKYGRLTGAVKIYTEGLKINPANTALLCNRAAALFKLGQYEQCIDDCNQALLMDPRYQKAILQRAAANTKLKRWADAVNDYELLMETVPHDMEVLKESVKDHSFSLPNSV